MPACVHDGGKRMDGPRVHRRHAARRHTPYCSYSVSGGVRQGIQHRPRDPRPPSRCSSLRSAPPTRPYRRRGDPQRRDPRLGRPSARATRNGLVRGHAVADDHRPGRRARLGDGVVEALACRVADDVRHGGHARRRGPHCGDAGQRPSATPGDGDNAVEQGVVTDPGIPAPSRLSHTHAQGPLWEPAELVEHEGMAPFAYARARKAMRRPGLGAWRPCAGVTYVDVARRGPRRLPAGVGRLGRHRRGPSRCRVRNALLRRTPDTGGAGPPGSRPGNRPHSGGRWRSCSSGFIRRGSWNPPLGHTSSRSWSRPSARWRQILRFGRLVRAESIRLNGTPQAGPRTAFARAVADGALVAAHAEAPQVRLHGGLFLENVCGDQPTSPPATAHRSLIESGSRRGVVGGPPYSNLVKYEFVRDRRAAGLAIRVGGRGGLSAAIASGGTAPGARAFFRRLDWHARFAAPSKPLARRRSARVITSSTATPGDGRQRGGNPAPRPLKATQRQRRRLKARNMTIGAHQTTIKLLRARRPGGLHQRQQQLRVDGLGQVVMTSRRRPCPRPGPKPGDGRRAGGGGRVGARAQHPRAP